jgi:hypothetical protein
MDHIILFAGGFFIALFSVAGYFRFKISRIRSEYDVCKEKLNYLEAKIDMIEGTSEEETVGC